MRLRAGLTITPGGRFVADIVVRDGWVVQLGSHPPPAGDDYENLMGSVVLGGWVLPFVAEPLGPDAQSALSAAGVTCLAIPSTATRGELWVDVVTTSSLSSIEDVATIPSQLMDRGQVAFTVQGSTASRLVDAAARVTAAFRGTIVVGAEHSDGAAVATARRAARAGGRVVVGPLRNARQLRQARAAGLFPAVEPGWLLEHPGRWEDLRTGAIQLLIASSLPIPSLAELYRDGPGHGRVSAEVLSAASSARPAALLGCGVKGIPAPGRHADLAVLTPNQGSVALDRVLVRGHSPEPGAGRVIRCEPVEGLP